MRYFVSSTITQDGPPCDPVFSNNIGGKSKKKKRRKEAPLQKIGLGP